MIVSEKYPTFSVLMSVYRNDNPEHLNLALKSIEEQTVKPTEIIIVEDGPISKELKMVILKHKEKFGSRFRDVISKKNCGLASALQLGTSYLTTNWVARMDADDYSLPNRFENQLKLIKSNQNLVIVGGQIKEFSKNINNIVGERKVPISQKKIIKFIKWRSPFNHPTVMIRKDALDEVGGYIPFGNLEDYYLWARIVAKGFNIRNLPVDLVYMRVDNGLYSRRGKLKNIKYIYMLRRFLRKNNFLNFYEEFMGNIIMLLNIISPTRIRKFVYQNIIHKF